MKLLCALAHTASCGRALQLPGQLGAARLVHAAGELFKKLPICFPKAGPLRTPHWGRRFQALGALVNTWYSQCSNFSHSEGCEVAAYGGLNLHSLNDHDAEQLFTLIGQSVGLLYVSVCSNVCPF